MDTGRAGEALAPPPTSSSAQPGDRQHRQAELGARLSTAGVLNDAEPPRVVVCGDLLVGTPDRIVPARSGNGYAIHFPGSGPGHCPYRCPGLLSIVDFRGIADTPGRHAAVGRFILTNG